MRRRYADEEELRQRVRSVWALARGEWGSALPESPPLVNFKYTGSAAGRAYYYSHVVEFNVQFMARERVNMLDETVPHELAHIVAFRLHGERGRGHGPLWRAAARRLGCSAERCHSYDTTGLRGVQRRWAYACGCRVHKLTTTRHRKAIRGTRYRCRRCGAALSRVLPGVAAQSAE